jgi:hypothetical protein
MDVVLASAVIEVKTELKQDQSGRAERAPKGVGCIAAFSPRTGAVTSNYSKLCAARATAWIESTSAGRK